MYNTIDIADLVQINKLLGDYINKLIAERSGLYATSFTKLSIYGSEIEKNANRLTQLLTGIDWQSRINSRPLLNEWKRSIVLQQLQLDDPETLEFEYWVIAALEAYKTALTCPALIDLTCRYTLIDQKFFLQAFLLDLIKCRELHANVEMPSLSAANF